MPISMLDQLESYRRNHIEPKTVKSCSPYNREKSGSAEREYRREQIYETMGNGAVWTVKQLKEILGWEVRQISSAMKVLADNGFVKIVGRTRIGSCKTCLYQRVK